MHARAEVLGAGFEFLRGAFDLVFDGAFEALGLGFDLLGARFVARERHRDGVAGHVRSNRGHQFLHQRLDHSVDDAIDLFVGRATVRQIGAHGFDHVDAQLVEALVEFGDAVGVFLERGIHFAHRHQAEFDALERNADGFLADAEHFVFEAHQAGAVGGIDRHFATVDIQVTGVDTDLRAAAGFRCEAEAVPIDAQVVVAVHAHIAVVMEIAGVGCAEGQQAGGGESEGSQAVLHVSSPLIAPGMGRV